MDQQSTLWIIIALLAGVVIGLATALWFISLILRAWLTSRDRGLRIE